MLLKECRSGWIIQNVGHIRGFYITYDTAHGATFIISASCVDDRVTVTITHIGWCNDGKNLNEHGDFVETLRYKL
jgi:hypothetical protein